MPYLMYKDTDDKDVKLVIAVSYDSKSAEVYPNGVWVDEPLPKATPSAGKTPQLRVRLSDKYVYYIYVDSAGQSTNDYLTRIKNLEDQIKQLKQAVDDIIMGGAF